MPLLYLSHFLDAETTPSYGNKPSQFQLEPQSCLCRGDSSNSHRITMSNHVGTHVDLPRHFDDLGAVLEDYQASDWFFSKVQLIEIVKKEAEFISFEDLEKRVNQQTDLLLIKTGFEKFRSHSSYWSHNPGFEADVGKLARTHFPNLRVIGFDFISVTSYTDRPKGRLAHKSFLSTHFPGKPIRIIEDMALEKINMSPEWVIVSPLLAKGLDGAQVTVIAKL